MPGLVFGMLPGGSCHGGGVSRAQAQGEPVLRTLWQREMPVAVYDPRWLLPHPAGAGTGAGVHALAQPPLHGHAADGTVPPHLRPGQGRYGSTQDYALDTRRPARVGIHDRALRRLIESAQDSQGDTPTAQSG
jgi:cation transport protein ChaC